MLISLEFSYNIIVHAEYIQILKITEAATPVGGKGTLLCSGTSLRNRDLNVTWTNMNGRVLQSNDTMNDGVITSSLTFSNVTETQFGLYTCTLTDGLCSVNSTTILDTAGEIIALMKQ